MIKANLKAIVSANIKLKHYNGKQL
jgi:hypothetical protein